MNRREMEEARWGLVYLFEILLVELVGNPDGSEDGDEEKGEWEHESEYEAGGAWRTGARYNELPLSTATGVAHETQTTELDFSCCW